MRTSILKRAQTSIVTGRGRHLSCALAIVATGALSEGCHFDFSSLWTGDECDDSTTVLVDTWNVACECGIPYTAYGGTTAYRDVRTEETTTCADGFAGIFGALALGNVCGKTAWRMYERTGVSWHCEPSAYGLVSTDDCSARVADCDDDGSSSSPLLEWKNPDATFIGPLDPARSHVTITVDGHSATPPLSGEVHLSGGQCPGASCDFVVDGLHVQVGDFTLLGASVEAVDLVNVGQWGGVKKLDNTYYFNPTSRLKLAGTIEGNRGFSLGFPTEAAGGAFFDTSAPLPGGGPVIAGGYLTIEGTFDYDGQGTAEIFLVFPFTGGAPRAVITGQNNPCGQGQNPPCGWSWNGGGSQGFDGSPIPGYQWFDAQGVLVGNSPTISESSVLQVPGQPSRLPLSLAVLDAEGRLSTRVTTFPPPARTGAFGWVWANDSLAASYTPLAAYNYNSAGAPNTITRSSAGVYTVTMPGIGSPTGNVQVTAYGPTDRSCKVGGWAPSGNSQKITVRCFDSQGGPADAMFNAFYFREAFVNADARSPNPGIAYLWADKPTTASYKPAASYAFNDAGDDNSIARLGVGRYDVQIPGLDHTGSHVQVTAYGSSSSRCKVAEFGRYVGGTSVEVRCFTAAGAPVDSMFTLALSRRTSPTFAAPALTRGAYAWVDRFTKGSAKPHVNFQYNGLSTATDGSELLGVTRSSAGNYVVAIPRTVAVSKDIVLVTAYGDDSVRCRAQIWTTNPKTNAQVKCTNSAGTPVDSSFMIQYLTSTP